MGLLGVDNKLRRVLVRLVNWSWFDRAVLAIIIVNSIILGLSDFGNLGRGGELSATGSWRNAVVYRTELPFAALFTLEMLIKILAMGFVFGPGTYLRDSWNVLDFIVVVAGYVGSVQSVASADFYDCQQAAFQHSRIPEYFCTTNHSCLAPAAFAHNNTRYARPSVIVCRAPSEQQSNAVVPILT